MATKFLPTVAFFIAAFLGSVQACERPQVNTHLGMSEIGGSGFLLSWTPVEGAKYYELKTIWRIPEGKILAQREVKLERPFFLLPIEPLLHQQYAHLLTELVAYCEGSKSETALAQIALKNETATCRFDASPPVLSKGTLSWPAVKEADSYLVCFFKEGATVTCRETADPQNKLAIERSRMLSIAPVCHHSSGTPFFIPMVAD